MKTVLYKGPDISKHNGIVNIKQIRDAGYKRVGIRAGYGKNNVDQRYIANAEACYNLGVDVLLYWFSYALNVEMAKNEGIYAVKQAAKFWKRCPIAFDLEYDTVNYARKNGVNIDKAMATNMAIAFLKEVKNAGYIPVIYTNKDYKKNYFDIARIATEVGCVYVWYARYTSKISEGELIGNDIWQYTSKGSIPGVAGNVDLNNFYTDFETEKVEVSREESKCNINILAFQAAANADGYVDADGNQLKEDGIDGPKTQYVRRQINLKAKRVGLVWKTGSRGFVVKWWQKRVNEILGHDNEVDGNFGKNTRKETIELQEALQLEVDGVAGYNSIQAAFYN